jgi:hypothetical protein
MGFELSTLVVIGTDRTGCCKSNYHTITTIIPDESFSIIAVERTKLDIYIIIVIILKYEVYYVHYTGTDKEIWN